LLPTEDDGDLPQKLAHRAEKVKGWKCRAQKLASSPFLSSERAQVHFIEVCQTDENGVKGEFFEDSWTFGRLEPLVVRGRKVIRRYGIHKCTYRRVDLQLRRLQSVESFSKLDV